MSLCGHRANVDIALDMIELYSPIVLEPKPGAPS
jgi:hypothetical protein